MNYKLWVKCALIRAVKTMAQAAISIISVSKAMGDVDWIMVGSASVLAGLLSILTSIAGLPEVELKEQVLLKEENEDGV